jgi:hypothetical protein
VATDPAKIKDIVEWKTPKTLKKLRGFLGLTGYYRRFIQGYSTICQPLYHALKKDNFQWGQQQEEAFQKLKTIMSTPPMLKLPDFTIPFVLETDACKSGLGAVSMQEGRPIAFFSQCLGPKTDAMSVYEKEALAVLHALKKWRHYFLGNQVIIKTDQQALKYVGKQRLVDGVQHKLLLKLLEFDYKIEYKKGKENTVADALSRQFQDDEMEHQNNKPISACHQTTLIIPKWLSEVQESYVSDPDCTKLLQELAIDEASHNHFTLQSGILRFKGKIYIGSSTKLRDKVFDTFHSSAFGGHSGIKATLHRIQQSFYWPKLKNYVTDKVAMCPICQIAKTERLPYPGLLQPVPIPQQKWAAISMDFISGLPKSRGKNVILVVVDRLTKYAHFLPLAHPYTVQTVADLFSKHIIKLHGPPSSIVSDRDHVFTSHLWKQILSSYNTKLHYSTAYHPETDGQTERVNQCLNNICGAWPSRNRKIGVIGYTQLSGGTIAHFTQLYRCLLSKHYMSILLHCSSKFQSRLSNSKHQLLTSKKRKAW